MKCRKFIFVFIITTAFCFAQKTDSLLKVFKNTALNDTVRLNALHEIGWGLSESDPDSALSTSKIYFEFATNKHLQKYIAKAFIMQGRVKMISGDYPNAETAFKNAYAVAQKIKDERTAASALSNIGVVRYNVSDYDSAIFYANKALQVRLSIKDTNGMAASYNNLANGYLSLSNYNEALAYYLKSLKLYEGRKNEIEISKAYNNIGNLYNMQKRFDTAKDYYLKAIAIRKKLNDPVGLSSSYSNLGVVYQSLNNIPQAIHYFDLSIEISAKINDYDGLIIGYAALGDVYKDQKKYDLAHEYFERSMSLSIKNNDPYAIASNYNSMAALAILEGKYKEAIDLSKKALKINTQENIVEGMRLNYQNLANASFSINDHKNAFIYHVRYKALTDSIFNVENSRMLGEAKTNYEVEKKAAELKIKAEAEKDKLNALAGEEKRRNVIIIFSVTGLLLVVLIFSVFLYQRFKVIQKQKHIIETQKELVDEKNKEITDSITYAKRLQEAILPPKEFVESFLPQSFILYKPKDLVAGDFYWMEVIDEKIFIAAADSTGHGVPGALVSVVCSNALNRTVKEFGLRETGKILDKTRELVLETFAKSSQQVKDGMDISLLCVDKKQNIIQWSGANNPLWYINKGERTISEIKANKQPIGSVDDPKPFTTHNFERKEGDIFYLFTDGFADQFGGPDGKKFKYRQFNDVLISNSNMILSEQQALLSKTFDDWKGKLEQVDDVCIIGIKI